jgi:hypothetical protein
MNVFDEQNDFLPILPILKVFKLIDLLSNSSNADFVAGLHPDVLHIGLLNPEATPSSGS